MKRIVVDFDDTLSFTKTRDWANAAPNTQLIEKLNDLYDDGWTIDIFTARGSLSCSTREAADKKYREQITAWLNKHHVKYNSLSFDKPLATYYIDDKGVTPDDFLDIDIRVLQGGLSGTDIYTDGTFVYKEDSRVQDSLIWFKEANRIGLDVPHVHHVIGNTMTMDYIAHDERFVRDHLNIALGLVMEALDKMIWINPDSTRKRYNFSSYIEKIKGHLDLMKESNPQLYEYCYKKFMDGLLQDDRMKKYDIISLCSHGDFGVKNLLFTDDRRMFIIDPIIDCYTSVQLDAAKFCASLLINDYDDIDYCKSVNMLATHAEMYRSDFSLLIFSELIRVYKYHPDKPFMERLLRYVTV